MQLAGIEEANSRACNMYCNWLTYVLTSWQKLVQSFQAPIALQTRQKGLHKQLPSAVIIGLAILKISKRLRN